ncbi:MAG: CRTAC1 family protein [Planctomycetes bacterium]|nr:CRTAC1 family protein [Planctomycetota bacterium]
MNGKVFVLAFMGFSLAGCSEDSPADSGSPSRMTGACFPDVALASGIDFLHRNGAAGSYQVTEIMGSGCAWIDYDQDGDLDAYLVCAGYEGKDSRNRLYRNNGDGTFSDVTEESGAGDTGFGMGCAVGDYNLDGSPDLYVTNFGPNALYRNNGDGTFHDVTGEAGVGDARWGMSAAFVDVDEDGLLDLFVTNYMKHPRHEGRPCADAAGRIEYCGPFSHFSPDRDTLYLNRGDGSFRDITRQAGMSEMYGYGLGVVCADFNKDGHVDLYVANDLTANQLWLGDGSGHFVDRAVELGAAYNQNGQAEASMGVQAEDVDGDAYLDLLVTNLVNETNTLYRGRERGFFEDITFRTGLGEASLPQTGFGMGFFDADHDGDLDLMVTNGRIRRGLRIPGEGPPPPWDLYAELDQFFEHVGEGIKQSENAQREDGRWGFRFVDRSSMAGLSFLVPHLGRGLALGDYDNDGDVDVLVTACAGRARLLRNDGPKRGHWLVVRAVAKGGKGDVYGARVTVKTKEIRWEREVHPAYSYLSSNDPRLHFGLGGATSCDVEVRWPDGSRAALKETAVDRILVLEKDKETQRKP